MAIRETFDQLNEDLLNFIQTGRKNTAAHVRGFLSNLLQSLEDWLRGKADLEGGRLKKGQESRYKPADPEYLNLSDEEEMERDEAIDVIFGKLKNTESKLPATLAEISISSNAPYDSMEGENAVAAGTVVTFGVVGQYEGTVEARIVPINEVAFEVQNEGPGFFTGNAYTAPAVSESTWVFITAIHIPTGITASLPYPLLIKPVTPEGAGSSGINSYYDF